MAQDIQSQSGKPMLLVAVDGSECCKRAVAQAIELARALQAGIILVHIIDWSDYSFVNVIEIDERSLLRNSEEKHARNVILEPLAQMVSQADIEVTVALRFGHPARSMIKIAEEIEAKMIIAGTRGRSDVASMVFGSFSHGLLQLTDRPLLLVP